MMNVLSILAFLISRYNPSLNKQIYYNKKVYFIDSKLADIVGFRFSEDKGRILENTVFLQLKRNNKKIYYHKEKKECDFLIKEGNNIIRALKVTWMLDHANEKREIEGLLEALSSYHLDEGTILTYDQEHRIKKNGKQITVVPVWRWLLES